MSKFTPGPWHVWPGPAYVGGGEDLCIGAGKTWLANMDHRNCKSRDAHFAEMVDHDKAGLEDDTDICSFTNEITEEQAANARLIAAAPELLEALKVALLLVENGNFSNGVTEYGVDEGVQMTRPLIIQIEAAIAKAEGRS